MNSFGYIYKITNKINGKCYIGQTSNTIQIRFNEHKSNSKNQKQKGYDYPLYRAFRKYGIDNFSVEEVEKCKVEDLNDRENYWMNYFDSLHNGYNQIQGGSGGNRIVLDEKEVIKKYEELHTLKKVSKYFNCSSDVIQHILNKNKIKIISAVEHTKMECKNVFQYDENNNLVNIFNSFTEAGQWLIDNHISNAKSDLNAGHSIRRLLLRGNNYLHNYYWKCDPEFTDNERNTYIKRVKKSKKKQQNKIYKKNKTYYKLCSCGNPKSINAKCCKSCENNIRQQNGIQQREKQYGLTRELFKQEIRKYTFVELSKIYVVSDNAIRKWCKQYNLLFKSTKIKNYSDEEWN